MCRPHGCQIDFPMRTPAVSLGIGDLPPNYVPRFMTAGFGRLPDLRVDLKHVAFRVAEVHRSVPPRLIGGRVKDRHALADQLLVAAICQGSSESSEFVLWLLLGSCSGSGGSISPKHASTSRSYAWAIRAMWIPNRARNSPSVQ